MCTNLADPSEDMSRMVALRLGRVAVAPKRALQAVRPTAVHLTGPAGLSTLVRRAAHWQSQALPFTTAAVCMRLGQRAKSSSAHPELAEDEDQGGTVVKAAAAAAATTSASTPGDVDTAAMGLATGEMKSKKDNSAAVTGSDTKSEVQGLDGVGLSSRMRDRLAIVGISDLFPVQRATFSALMNGKDMLVKARTGSGKTIGFALPIIEKIMAARGGQRPMRGRAPASVILAPTRELALQIQREFIRIESEVDSLCVYGGAPSQPQERALRDGVDVVVGTPGRVIDMLQRGALRMEAVKVFVLDEADEMLKMGFQEDVETIMEGLPADRQMNLWSATQPRWITQIARKYCNNLETMDMVGSNPVRTADTIRHVAAATSWEHKGKVTANMVRAHANGKRALVFCNTKMDVEAMAASPDLKAQARVIHGDVNQGQRERTLSDFRAGAFNVLVATDVAARGIDVPEIALVVQTKVPPHPSFHICNHIQVSCDLFLVKCFLSCIHLFLVSCVLTFMSLFSFGFSQPTRFPTMKTHLFTDQAARDVRAAAVSMLCCIARVRKRSSLNLATKLASPSLLKARRRLSNCSSHARRR